MNAAANWLFTFLLGWTGKLFNGGLKYISNNAAGLHSIFAVIWFPLLLILLCIGTALDFGVWFVRWRPQDLWRSEAHRKLIVKNKRDQQADLNETSFPESLDQLATWVSEEEPPMPELLDAFPPSIAPSYDSQVENSSAVNGFDAYPYTSVQQLSQADENALFMSPDAYQPYTEQMPAVTDMPEPFFAADMQQVLDQNNNALTAEQLPSLSFEAPTGYPQQEENVSEEQSASALIRRRRSNRHRLHDDKPRRASIGGLFNQLAPSDEDPLEGLPPPVSQENAFNAPVFPDSYPPLHQDDERLQ